MLNVKIKLKIIKMFSWKVPSEDVGYLISWRDVWHIILSMSNFITHKMNIHLKVFSVLMFQRYCRRDTWHLRYHNRLIWPSRQRQCSSKRRFWNYHDSYTTLATPRLLTLALERDNVNCHLESQEMSFSLRYTQYSDVDLLLYSLVNVKYWKPPRVGLVVNA